MSKKIIFLVLLAVVLFIVSIIFFQRKIPSEVRISPQMSQLTHEAKVKIGGKEILVEIAETPEEKAKGLSGKTLLAENEGLLFSFAQETLPAFWMKDMKIALDLIWIDKEKIIYINENVSPPLSGQKEANLPLYRPPQPINYVLEVNAGFSQTNGIKVGDSVDLTNLE